MGWWKVDSTENVIGDGPLDALGAAVSDVIHQYQEQFGRKPTRQEWEALLQAVMASEDPQFTPSGDGIVRKVTVVMDP